MLLDPRLLEKLSNACGLSGDEGALRDTLRLSLADDACEIYTDTIGNLICRKGNGPVRVMLDAHLDEVGLVVSGSDEAGLLRFRTSGSIDARVLPGREVLVGPGHVPGVIGAQAVHLLNGDERDKVIPAKDLRIDIGARTREEAAEAAPPGTPAYFSTKFERLSERVVKGKAFDDRAGCAILADVLRGPTYEELTVLAVFSVQEEVGLRGAQAAAYALAPDVAIAIDGTSASDVPGAEPPATNTHVGQGPAISVMDSTVVMDLGLRDQLVRLAEENKIPYQFRRLTTSGTDAGGIFYQRKGVPVANVSVPCRYIHSPVSLADLGDMGGASALIRLFLEGLDKGDFQI